MAQSTEYPALRWVEPASWTNANRTSVQLIVIHTTEGSATDTSAEGGAAYDARRTDGTSTHYFHDSGSTVQCVRTNDIAHTARRQGNLRGIQHELCTKAGSSAATWGNAYHQAMLRLAAQQCALDARKWGIPVRHLTVAQVSGGVKGFCGHVDITRAFPQDGGTHTDPGGNFPWLQFLDMVREEIEELDMTPETIDAIADAAAAATALKIHNDLRNPDSGLYKSVTERVQAGVLAFAFDAFHAANNTATYTGATADVQKRMRNARDTLLGVLGGPVDLAEVTGGVAEVRTEVEELKALIAAAVLPAQG